jgi:hypothetical protein
MAMSKSSGGGPFGVPSGPEGVYVEVPDGVTCAYAGEARNSLTNAEYVYGGYDGHGFGYEQRSSDGTGTTSVIFGGDSRNPGRLRIG